MIARIAVGDLVGTTMGQGRGEGGEQDPQGVVQARHPSRLAELRERGDGRTRYPSQIPLQADVDGGEFELSKRIDAATAPTGCQWALLKKHSLCAGSCFARNKSVNFPNEVKRFDTLPEEGPP